jgi:Uncharacterised nucleotidyltransferase
VTDPARTHPGDQDPTGVETDLLLMAAGARRRTDGSQSAQDRLGEVSWGRLLARAERQGVLALLAVYLRGRQDALPPQVAEALRRHTYVCAAAHQDMSRQALEVIDWLAAAGVEALLIKGPALAASLYAPAWLREYEDLDLLIRPRDLPRAVSALQARGYAPDRPVEPGQLASRVTYGVALNMFGEGRVALDLHWRLASRLVGFPLAEEVWSRVARVELPGGSAATLQPEDALIYQAFHGSKHQWVRLNWISDLARLAAGPLDWGAAWARAERVGAARTLAIGLEVTRRLLGASSLPPGSAAPRADPQAGLQAAEAAARLARDDTEWPPSARLAFSYEMREDPRDRLGMLLDLVWSPRGKEWSALDLPKPLHHLYPLVRLARLARRHAGRLVWGKPYDEVAWDD